MAEPSPARIDESQFLDPRWRLSNLYTITDKAGRQVPFRPNTAQLAFLDELHSANLILKARQLGFTTLCCLIYLDACVFSPNTRAGVIAHKLDDAKVIFRDKIKYSYDRLDEGIRNACPAVQDSADTLTFGNNSSIPYALPGDPVVIGEEYQRYFEDLEGEGISVRAKKPGT
jgi:hypothetical protein